jgi:hypothetical protein
MTGNIRAPTGARARTVRPARLLLGPDRLRRPCDRLEGLLVTLLAAVFLVAVAAAPRFAEHLYQSQRADAAQLHTATAVLTQNGPSDNYVTTVGEATALVAVRVPVEDGSLTDLTAVLAREATADEVNDAFARAAAGPVAGILSYSTDPLVSRDIIGDPSSCVFDSGLTQAAGTLVKIFGWYDNEWGYTCRLADLTAIVGGRL